MNTTALMNTYGQRPLTIDKGAGCFLWDTDGKQYLDALAGIAVCGLGHCHPAVVNAIKAQADTLIHISNLYNLPVQQKAGEHLCRVSGMDKVFFSNSGAEATRPRSRSHASSAVKKVLSCPPSSPPTIAFMAAPWRR